MGLPPRRGWRRPPCPHHTCHVFNGLFLPALTASCHQLILDAEVGEIRPVRRRTICLVAVSAPLVSADQRGKHLAVMQIGAARKQFADQYGPLIHPDMQLVAKLALAILFRERGARIEGLYQSPLCLTFMCPFSHAD